MTVKTVDDLARLLVGLRLVESSQLDECLTRLGPTSQRPAHLLRVLESKHYLTPYQVSRLEKGEVDSLVLGRYKLMYRNASGSFARVFRACCLDDGSMVGLKVLRHRWAADPRYVAQFRREAEVCKKLKHKNIVPIYSVGSQGDYHYFTMEFVEGGNLRDFLNIRNVLSPAEATRYVLDMCQGLAYALERGVTHRDIKMTNVLMSTQGVAKLVDFGLAGDQGSPDQPGSDGFGRALEYATLEKWTNAPTNDPRSDLYFLGGIYYELLSGTPPYPRTRSREERKQFSRYANIRPLSSAAPNVPRVVLEIVNRLMELSPSRRYQTPAEVIADLHLALEELDEPPDTPRRESAESTPMNSLSTHTLLPTVMCIESRVKQQNVLREYLSKRGFRVLMLSELSRGLKRMKTNPPDCVIFLGEAIGEPVIEAFQQAAQLQSAKPIVVIAVLAQRQSDWTQKLEQSDTARVLVQPVTLRDLRREIHLAFQRNKRLTEKLGSPPTETL